MAFSQRWQDKKLKTFAKSMRRNMTKEERHLWFDFLQSYPVRIMRQKIIAGYIVDFYCAEAKLAIELDGSQHYETDGKTYDLKRTQALEAQGIKVIRFSNLEIWKQFPGVKFSIHREISERRKR